ncbi:MAG: NADH-quinone oxidoreductase subunit L [Spirochaetes bacterium]|nr:MAG: NADH-quinone oxidoreductase subunit L [Spirochaetota bacterium]
MHELIWIIPALPFAGFALLALSWKRLPRGLCAAIGSGSVGLSALGVLALAPGFVASGGEGAITRVLWNWLSVTGFSATVSLRVDALSLAFMFIITFVGFLIHVYSAEFIRDDEGHGRFFAYLNLFVGSMLVLVMADDLMLLYLGWEGVGLCSYLLIGFWYRESANGAAARKAFLITRIGDTAMIGALFIFVTSFSTLNIQEILGRAAAEWTGVPTIAVIAAFLLLGGAVGKSAQLPLQTWLPDAMAGPSPVSALIHAATMVTAGVYLVARTHTIFELAPQAQAAVACIGAATLLLAGFSAMAQTDFKRILAYSTISQIGYMFLALGVGAWSAAVFHFMMHAFFKALLFLGAGAVIVAMHEEHDIFKMGGLRKSMPVVFWTFLAGASSLAALPFVTDGFYSKDLILLYAWAGPGGSPWLWGAGILGAFVTAAYTFRMVFTVFFGDEKKKPRYAPGLLMLVPLSVLGVLSLVAGFVELPESMGEIHLVSDTLSHALPATPPAALDPATGHLLEAAAVAATLAGIALAWLLYLRFPGAVTKLVSTRVGAVCRKFFLAGWGFDALYDFLIVGPFEKLARVNKNDVLDLIYTGAAGLSMRAGALLSLFQNGRLRRYALWIAAGAILFLGMVIAV